MGLLGKLVAITDMKSLFYGAEGIVKGFDGERYYIRIGKYGNNFFKREQFSIPGMEG